MANKFCDTTFVGGGDTGADWDTNPWLSIEKAMEAANSAGDKIWHRRLSSFANPTSDIAPTADGTLSSPIRHIAWPRASIAGTITFMNGESALIGTSVAGVRGRHMARLIKNNDADDGWYFIEALIVKLPYDNLQGGTFAVGNVITGGTSGIKGKIHYINGSTLYLVTYDPATGLPALFTPDEQISCGAVTADVNQAAGGIYDGFLLDREYAGTTAPGANFEIKEDEDYDDRPDIGLLRTTWDADAHDLPVIDFGANDYQLIISDANNNVYKCFDLRNSVDSYGTVRINRVQNLSLIGCLFVNNQNVPLIRGSFGASYLNLKYCIICGNNAGSSQRGFFSEEDGKILSLSDCAIYNMGDNGLYSAGTLCILNNVNIGIALNNGDHDIYLTGLMLTGKDVKFGGINGSVYLSLTILNKVSIENYGKILGAHCTWFNNGKILSNDCSVDPNQRSGGANSVIEIDCNGGSAANAAIDDWAETVFEHEFEQTAGSKTYRYYVQNTAEINASDAKDAADIWLEGEFIETYDDTSEYVMGRHADGHLPVRSVSAHNPMPARADADDWGEYLEITMNAATASKVRIRCKVSWYDSGDKIYIDPMVVIS